MKRPTPSSEQLQAELALLRAELAKSKKETAELAARLNHPSSSSGPAAANMDSADVRLICDALPALIAEFDREGRHLFANARYEEWFGISRGALSQQRLGDVLGAKTYSRMTAQVNAALAGEKVYFEFWLPACLGATRYVSVHLIPRSAPASAEPIGFFALIVDITERKKDEQEMELLHAQLSGHRQRLIDLVRSVPGIVWEAWGQPDLGSQRINFVSSHVETMLGYQVEEWLANPNFWLTLVHPADKERAAREAAAIFRSGRGGVCRFRWVAKHGRVLWVESSCVVIKDGGGTPLGMRGVTIDISERRQAEEAIRHLNRELELRVEERTAALHESNQQMEAFCYSISHDLRAPLRAVQGFSQALLEDYGPALDATGREYTERVAAAASLIDELIQDLLEYSRAGRADPRLSAVSLRDMVAQTLAECGSEIEEARAEINVRDPMPVARAQPALLQQALRHLLENALKFTRPGAPPRIEIRAEVRAGKARLCVRDNGLGIHAQHFDRIFRPFERLHGANAYPGTGMGLAVVRKAMDRMGGSAGVESEEGAGSCFWLEMSLAPPEQK